MQAGIRKAVVSRLLILVGTLLLSACQAPKGKLFESYQDDLLVTIKGHDEDCRGTRSIDASLQQYVDEYRSDAEIYGRDQFPLDRLDAIRELRFVALGDPELGSDKGRLGLNKLVKCYDNRRVYRIYIVDPESTPAGHRLRNKNLLRQVVYHELTHTSFDHYDHRNDAKSADFGIMAAITNDHDLDDAEMNRRKIELFSPDSGYREHLPERN